MDENMKLIFRRPTSELERMKGIMLLSDLFDNYSLEELEKIGEKARKEPLNNTESFKALMDMIRVIEITNEAAKLLGFESFVAMKDYVERFGPNTLF